MKIKITMRYHLTLVRITITKKKSLLIINAREDMGKENPLILLVRMQLIQSLWRIVWVFLKKKKKKLVIKLPYNVAIPHLGIYPEEIRTEKDTCTPMFIEPLFAIERT